MNDKPTESRFEPKPAPGEEWPWDRRYAEHPWPTEPDAALVELATPLAPGKALDLGCGPGRNAIWLARQGWTVIGVDASAVGLAQARGKAAEAGVTIEAVHADLLNYEPAAQHFDLVVIANIHLLEPERGRLFARASEALCPGGHLFVVGHHLDSLGRAGPPEPDRLYTEELLREAFPTLSVERIQRHQRHGAPGEEPLTDIVVWAQRPS